MNKTVLLGAMISAVALSSWGASAQNASVTVNQVIDGKTVDLGGAPYVNPVIVDLDITSPTDHNQQSGDQNLQENTADVEPSADGADATVVQSLRNSRFNTESSDTDPAEVHNSAIVDITATDDVGVSGVNAAAGAFNIQANAAAIAMVPTGDLANSTANVSQFTQQDVSVQHDTTNELTTNIVLDDVSGVFGLNVATGVGNTQSNTASIANQLPSP